MAAKFAANFGSLNEIIFRVSDQNSISPTFENATAALSPLFMSTMPLSNIVRHALISSALAFGALVSSLIDASIMVVFDTGFL